MIMKFSNRRTPQQAIGWFLAFLLIGAVLAVFVGEFGGRIVSGGTSVHEVVQGAAPFIKVTGVMYVLVLAVMLLWNRPKSAANILLALLGIILSMRFGAGGGLIPLAVLTTRASNASPEVTKVFE